MRADSHLPLAAFGRAFCAALLLAVAGNALSLPGRRFVGHYDFGYAIHGDRAARPAQVFDDGSGKLYFEARPNQPMPAVFAGRDLALVVLQPEGQYFTARTSADEFTLVLGEARARVRRGGGSAGAEAGADAVPLAEGDAPVAARGSEHEQPIVFAPGQSRLRPEVLDALSALVVRIGRDTPITAIGREDAGAHEPLATLRAEALRNALLARGVAASLVHLVVDDAVVAGSPARASALRWSAPVSSSADPLVFDITPADRDIAASLRRWARASGYELVWDTGWVAPVNGTLRVEAPTFLAAVDQVVSGLRAQGYPVRVQASADRVLRFTASE